MRARSVAEVIAGEAVSGTPEQRMADMRAIASVIANRAQSLGITPQEVVANSREFNAYNRSLPPGVGQGIIDMAQQAIDDVAATGPTNNATFYATPSAVGNLPGGLSFEDQTTGHQYFSDPQNRAIGSALGYIQPNAYGYAQNLADVPTPFSPGDLTNGSLLSAFQETAPAQSPFDAVLGSDPGWGLNRDVAPVPYETFNQWDAVASAPPVQAPASGLLSQSAISQADIGRALFDPTTAGMDPSFTAGLMGPSNAVVPSAVETTSYSPTSVSSRMGVAEPGFDMGRFASMAPAVASDFDAGRFGDVQSAAFDASRFGGGLLNPATNTTSFMDQPAQAVAQTPGLLSPSSMALGSPTLTGGIASDVIGGQPVQQTGFVDSFPAAVANNTFEPAAYQAPALETISVPDQPSIATVEGPATTPALDQQTQSQSTVAAPSTEVGGGQTSKPSLASRLSKAINPGTIGGGLLGGLALGPAGGLVGGLLGNAAYNGNMGGLLGSPSYSINNIGTGPAAAYSVWGGGTPIGTQATASDGQRITSLPGGLIGVTNAQGITTGFDSNGKAYSVWGGISDDAETESSNSGGGFFGGLLG